MTQWFGEPWPRADWRAPICEDDRNRILEPVGESCYKCNEVIVVGDRGVAYPFYDPPNSRMLYAHIECDYMGVVGPPAFHRGECRHSGGTGPCFDEDRTYREQALEVWERVH